MDQAASSSCSASFCLTRSSDACSIRLADELSPITADICSCGDTANKSPNPRTGVFRSVFHLGVYQTNLRYFSKKQAKKQQLNNHDQLLCLLSSNDGRPASSPSPCETSHKSQDEVPLGQSVFWHFWPSHCKIERVINNIR